MSYNGFKGHENGKKNSSDEKDDDSSSSDLSEVEGFCVVKNQFPRVTTVEDATDGSRLVIDKEMMSAAFRRKDSPSKQKESRMTRQKSYEEKHKVEKLDESRNTPSVKREPQGAMQAKDDAALKKQLKLSKTPKSEGKQKVEMVAVHQRRCKETQAEHAEFEKKKMEKQEAQAYPRAPTKGLPGFSQSATMQAINLCDKCDCTPDEQPCMQCRGYNWHCQGTCTCCEVQRNLEEAMKDIE